MRLYLDAAADAYLPLSYPVVEPDITMPMHVNLGNKIWLEGYDLQYDTPIEPGDVLTLTLYWRAQQSIDESYKVFNQSYYGDGKMVAQQDGYPVCGRGHMDVGSRRAYRRHLSITGR